jgi:phosphatidylserine decarboxylase
MRGEFPVCVVQIADQYVHKIQCWVKEGDSINKGDKLGLIRMGSQVDIIIPSLKNLNILVKEGDHVKAGEDILATY